MLTQKLQKSLYKKEKKPDPTGEMLAQLEIFKAGLKKQMDEFIEFSEVKLEDIVQKLASEQVEKVAIKLAIKMAEIEKGDKGEPGDSVKGEPGDTYVLKEEDKMEIASKIKVPVVEKVIEKTETIIKEQPIVTEVVKVTNEIVEVAKYEEALPIANKLNTLTEKVEQSVIIGLEDWKKKVVKRLEKGGGSAGASGGGGMGLWVHEQFVTSSATTTVTLNKSVAAGSNAILVRYNGQLLDHGVQYTISGKVITFTFTLDDSSSVGVTYVRT